MRAGRRPVAIGQGRTGPRRARSSGAGGDRRRRRRSQLATRDGLAHAGGPQPRRPLHPPRRAGDRGMHRRRHQLRGPDRGDAVRASDDRPPPGAGRRGRREGGECQRLRGPAGRFGGGPCCRDGARALAGGARQRRRRCGSAHAEGRHQRRRRALGRNHAELGRGPRGCGFRAHHRPRRPDRRPRARRARPRGQPDRPGAAIQRRRRGDRPDAAGAVHQSSCDPPLRGDPRRRGRREPAAVPLPGGRGRRRVGRP